MFLAFYFTITIALAVASKKREMGNVMECTDRNFDSKMTKIDNALVLFYVPWCGYCKSFKPQFTEADAILKKRGTPVTLVKVNCDGDGQETCQKYNVGGYPDIKLFKRGKLREDYEGRLRAIDVIKYAEEKCSPKRPQ